MILKESPPKSPDTGEDKVDLIKFSRGVWWSVVLCQQAVQQGAQSLIEQNIDMLQNTSKTKDNIFIDNKKELCFAIIIIRPTCTMLFSGIGVMVFRLQRTCSKQ